MKKIAKIFFAILLFCFCLNNFEVQAKIDDLIMDFEELKAKFPKKKVEEKPKMPETKEEWEIEAQNIPLEERKIEQKVQEFDTKKYNVPDIKYAFVKYNYPQGTRGVNIEDITKNLYSYPFLVADSEYKYVAYPRFYFSPDNNQISLDFYVEKLDTSKNKTKRILEFEHMQKEREPVVEAGLKDYYPNLFKGLILVDWSKDSKKLLIKESVGSRNAGIYKTNLYVHFMPNDVESSKTIKLTDFDNDIKYYFLDWENKQIVKYRYDIQPLGFNDENDNEIIAICWVLDKENNKINLGIWGYDVVEKKTTQYEKMPNISINGVFLRETWN